MTRRQQALVNYHHNLVQIKRKLNRAQADFDRIRNRMDEDAAWEMQAQIDRKRFEVELELLNVRARLSKP